MKNGAADGNANGAGVTKSDLDDNVPAAAEVEGGSGTGAAAAAATGKKTDGGDKKSKKKPKKWPMVYSCTCGSYTCRVTLPTLNAFGPK